MGHKDVTDDEDPGGIEVFEGVAQDIKKLRDEYNLTHDQAVQIWVLGTSWFEGKFPPLTGT